MLRSFLSLLEDCTRQVASLRPRNKLLSGSYDTSAVLFDNDLLQARCVRDSQRGAIDTLLARLHGGWGGLIYVLRI